MGQKVHPYGFRLGINRTWRSRWFARKDYGALLHEDLRLKSMLKKKFAHAGISRIEVERAANKLTIIIFTSRPGIIVGKKGTEIEKLKKDLQLLTGRDVNLKIQEVNKPELDSQLVAEGIAQQLEKRIAFRRAMRPIRPKPAFTLVPIAARRLEEKRANGDFFFATVFREGVLLAAEN